MTVLILQVMRTMSQDLINCPGSLSSWWQTQMPVSRVLIQLPHLPLCARHKYGLDFNEQLQVTIQAKCSRMLFCIKNTLSTPLWPLNMVFQTKYDYNSHQEKRKWKQSNHLKNIYTLWYQRAFLFYFIFSSSFEI